MSYHDIAQHWSKLNQLRVIVALFNSVFRHLIYIGKLSALGITINGFYYCLIGFSKHPVDSLILLILSVTAAVYYSACINDLHKVTLIFPSAKRVLLPALIDTANKFPSVRGKSQYAYMKKWMRMRCGMDVAVHEASFQRISRMSFVLFIDYLVQRVISLLVAKTN